MKSVVVGDVTVERHRRYVAAYLALPGVAARVRVQGFGLPDGNLWVMRPCSMTGEQRQAAVDKVRVVMAGKVIKLPRLSGRDPLRVRCAELLIPGSIVNTRTPRFEPDPPMP